MPAFMQAAVVGWRPDQTAVLPGGVSVEQPDCSLRLQSGCRSPVLPGSPEPERQQRRGTFYSPGMLGTAVHSRSAHPSLVDREIDSIAAALEEAGPLSREELSRRVGAPLGARALPERARLRARRGTHPSRRPDAL